MKAFFEKSELLQAKLDEACALIQEIYNLDAPKEPYSAKEIIQYPADSIIAAKEILDRNLGTFSDDLLK